MSDLREGAGIRPAAVAGQFYPREAAELRQAIDAAYLSRFGPGKLPVLQDGPRRVFGIMAPHAGYPYSAACAAWAFAEVAASGRPAAVVLLGVNHQGIGAPVALSPASGWQTPLGVMPVATQLGQRLLTLDDRLALDARAHQNEHSLEVQVPFIQSLFGEVPIVPIVIGHATWQDITSLSQALATLTRAEELLLLASSDLSHYIPAREATVLDQMALQQVAAVNADGLVQVVQSRGISMCGVLPVAAMLQTARASGAATATILHYHTSGDITGDRQEVVGYGAAAVYR